jgi:hypothetical protein
VKTPDSTRGPEATAWHLQDHIALWQASQALSPPCLNCGTSLVLEETKPWKVWRVACPRDKNQDLKQGL